MKHLLSYVAAASVVSVGAGVFLVWGIGIALVVTGGLFLGLSVYSAERINHVPHTD